MRAMVLGRTGSLADDGGDPPVLELRRLPVPEPGPGEVLVRVQACGVCHTDLDQAEGRIAPPRLPVVPGHQAVATGRCSPSCATTSTCGWSGR